MRSSCSFLKRGCETEDRLTLTIARLTMSMASAHRRHSVSFGHCSKKLHPPAQKGYQQIWNAIWSSTKVGTLKAWQLPPGNGAVESNLTTKWPRRKCAADSLSSCEHDQDGSTMLSAERCENDELRRDELVCTMHPSKALNSLQDKKSATGAPGIDLNCTIKKEDTNYWIRIALYSDIFRQSWRIILYHCWDAIGILNILEKHRKTS